LLRNADTIIIENLPSNYNHLMLQELLRNYPGIDEHKLNSSKQSAVVRFDSPDDAKLALSGKIN
jgi:hypothetical protein